MDPAEKILERRAAKSARAPEQHQSSGVYECEKIFRGKRDDLYFTYFNSLHKRITDKEFYKI